MRYLMLIPLLLAGCAQNNFTKPNTSQAQFESDKAQCLYEAKVGAVGAAGFEALKERELAVECMKARGNTLVN